MLHLVHDNLWKRRDVNIPSQIEAIIALDAGSLEYKAPEEHLKIRGNRNMKHKESFTLYLEETASHWGKHLSLYSGNGEEVGTTLCLLCRHTLLEESTIVVLKCGHTFHVLCVEEEAGVCVLCDADSYFDKDEYN